MDPSVPPAVFQEMVTYYRARAGEYDQWWDRVGRYDHGPELNQRWLREREVVYAAFDALKFAGHVLELAPGTGVWTRRLTRTAQRITAVDASPEMIDINRASVASPKVDYIQADLFDWSPAATYDGVVFGFWISHVPARRLDHFFGMVAKALRPGGALFFVDGQKEPSSTAADHVLPGEDQEVMTRRLNDGRAFRIVKSFHPPQRLIEAGQRAGLEIRIHTTPTYFYYGIGQRV